MKTATAAFTTNSTSEFDFRDFILIPGLGILDMGFGSVQTGKLPPPHPIKTHL
jgi:hypothetical protein